MRSQNSHAVRNDANTIMCPQCHAAPGDVCFRRGSAGERIELVGPPAHHGRLEAARKLRELPFEEVEKP